MGLIARLPDIHDSELLHPPIASRSVEASSRSSAIGVSTTAVIADHHPLTLEGLSHLLRECSIDVLQRCTTGRQLLESLIAHQPSLTLLDIHIGDPDGLSVLREVRRRGLLVPVILMTGPLGDGELVEGVRLGIRGLVRKDDDLEKVAECVRTVAGGGTCLDQALVGRALSAVLSREAALRELTRLLTGREIEIFKMCVTGKQAREIASTLGVSGGTVKVHLHHIYEKLQVSSRAQLVEFGRDRGIL